jgi:hypothetical protein
MEGAEGATDTGGTDGGQANEEDEETGMRPWELGCYRWHLRAAMLVVWVLIIGTVHWWDGRCHWTNFISK